MAKFVSKEEEMAIVKAIKKGHSITRVAKDFKRSKRTISKYAKANGIESIRLQTKKATEVLIQTSKERRRKNLEEITDIIMKGFRSPDITSKDIFDLSKSYGVIIDKLRLEEGEPTEISNSNVNNTNMVHPSELTKEAVETLAKRLRERNGSS